MSLMGALGAATSGLDSIARQLAVVSQNVANAGTPGYVRESAPAEDAGQSGVALGVRTGVTVRNLDLTLQTQMLASSADVAGQGVQSTALAGLDAASGAPGSGYDLPGLLGGLRDGFSTLASDPANSTLQNQVVTAADGLARGVNALGAAISNARQAAQDGIVADVATANTALRSVGTLSDQIIAAQARGVSTAGLEDARDQQVQVVANMTGARFLRQSNGDMLAVAHGVNLPLRGASGPLAVLTAVLAADTPAIAVPLVTMGGQDVTGSLTGGQIGANLALRDKVLPSVQAGLDAVASALASGFNGAGLPLFTNAAGAVPAAGTVGFAQGIQVSSAIRAAPTMLRDGTAAAGPAGSTTLINKVLGSVLASGGGSVAALASSLTAGIAQSASHASSTLDANKAAQSSLQTRLAADSGVSVDDELATMVRLQGAYAANAKVLSATNSMWQAMLDTVR